MAMASNLRGAPLFLRPSVVRQMIDDKAAIRAAVVQVPLLPITLVDRPRASEDPRLAKANDDIAELPARSAVKRKKRGSDRVAPTDASGQPDSIRAKEPELPDWPDAPLPKHAGLDLHRAAPDSEFESRANAGAEAERDQIGEASVKPVSRSAAGRSAAATSEFMDVTVGETTPRTARIAVHAEMERRKKIKFEPPAGETIRAGQDGSRESVSPIQRALPDPLRNTAGNWRSPTPTKPLRNLGRRTPVATEPLPEPKPGREGIRAMAEKLAAKRAEAARKIDWAKVAEAHRTANAPGKLQSARTMPALEPAPSREQCPRCGIPGSKGCAHFLPCAEPLPAASKDGETSARLETRFTGRRQGIGASRL